MALLQTMFRSRVLQLETSVNVVLPYDRYDAQGKRIPYNKVLYLLHGLKGNAWSWLRQSRAERYASEFGYALIMPEVHRSFYTDMAQGLKYFTYITEELPQVMQDMLRLPLGRDHTFVGGLSMGGYGALKCVLARPDLFGGGICISGGYYSLATPHLMLNGFYEENELHGILGETYDLRKEDDLDHLMSVYPADVKKPRLYLACGTEDFLYKHNVRAHESLTAHGFAHTYEEWPGVHDWRFFDAAAQRGMQLLSQE